MLSRFTSQRLGFQMPREDEEALPSLLRLIQAGRLTPVVDRTYSLNEVPEAIRNLARGHARGKSVILVRDTPP